MKTRLRTLPLAWALLYVFPTCGGSESWWSSGPQDKDFLTPPAIEEGILVSLNRERERNGRPPLRSLPALAEVARAHSREMAAASRLFHVSESEKPLNDRLVAAGLFFAKTGENVARSDSFLPALIHQELLESPPHRENMLDSDYDAVGVGVVSVDNRTYYVSQIFLRSILTLDKEAATAELKRHANEIRRAAGVPPLVFWEEADTFADVMLLSRSHGAQVPEPPARFGAVKGFFSESPFLGFQDKAASEIVKPPYTHAGLALDFRRTIANPGGAYLLAMLLMSENQLDRPEADLVSAVFDAVNARRHARGLPELEMSASLTGEARKAASASDAGGGRGRPTSQPVSGHRVMTYITFDPADLPAAVESRVLEAGWRFIGIQAAFRRTKEYPMGVIRVALVISVS
jgi:uncharacterized protein YkwD